MNVSPRIATVTLTFWALCLAHSLPACAQLVVNAPAPASAQSLSFWYAHHIPARFHANTRLVIREMPDVDMDAYLLSDSHDLSHADGDDIHDIDGVYESDPDRMALRLTQGRLIDMFTFAHEYGHYVWFHLFTDDDRRRYETLYKHQRFAGHLVTRYAETDVEEGFAEAFSFYAAEPPILASRDPASSLFLTQWNLRTHPSP